MQSQFRLSTRERSLFSEFRRGIGLLSRRRRGKGQSGHEDDFANRPTEARGEHAFSTKEEAFHTVRSGSLMNSGANSRITILDGMGNRNVGESFKNDQLCERFRFGGKALSNSRSSRPSPAPPGEGERPITSTRNFGELAD
ncbi:hypothetical protein TRVL_03701 [Trypanosoma vivax]|nr:hypothetical protein TRVL_03701 [Trypanosoma vivax]